MLRFFEFGLDGCGLDGVRFAVRRESLDSDGGPESDFLAGVRGLRRHPVDAALTQILAEMVTDTDLRAVVVIRNPALVLDRRLPGRIGKALAALPGDDHWSVAGAGGLGEADRRHLALYASATPAIPDCAGPAPLLDLMPDLYLLNAAFARSTLAGWTLSPDTALEPILTIEGYVADRVAMFLPQLSAGIDGTLLGRDLGKLRRELAQHFLGRHGVRAVATLSGTFEIPGADENHDLPPNRTSLQTRIRATIARHSDPLSVSIVVRTGFARNHLLERLLASLTRARRDATEIEVILSSDRPLAECQAHTDRLQRLFCNLTLRLEHNAPSDLSRITNLIGGLRAATRDYVMVIDDDDYVDVVAFEALETALFLGNRPLIVSGAAVHEEGWEETPSGRWVLSSNQPIKHYPCTGWRGMFSGVNGLPICAFLAPRDLVLRQLDRFHFDHDLSEDYALFLLILLAQDLPGVHEIPETLCHISLRGTENSVTMADRRPWVRDISGYLADLTGTPAVAGPGRWALMTLPAAANGNPALQNTLDDLNAALARTEQDNRLLRQENARLRRHAHARAEAGA